MRSFGVLQLVLRAKIEVRRVVPLAKLARRISGHAVDHASALDRRARRALVGPALDILVIVDLQELARVIDASLGTRAIPGPALHVGASIVPAPYIIQPPP